VCARPAAVKWHGRLETEAPLLTLAEAQLALVASASLALASRPRRGASADYSAALPPTLADQLWR